MSRFYIRNERNLRLALDAVTSVHDILSHFAVFNRMKMRQFIYDYGNGVWNKGESISTKKDMEILISEMEGHGLNPNRIPDNDPGGILQVVYSNPDAEFVFGRDDTAMYRIRAIADGDASVYLERWAYKKSIWNDPFMSVEGYK